MRASHSDRSRVENELRLAFQEGRIQLDELDARLSMTNESKTYGDLVHCIGDLPGGTELILQLSQHASPTTLPQSLSMRGAMPSRAVAGRRRFHPIWIALSVVLALNVIGSMFVAGPFGRPEMSPFPLLVLVGGAVFLYRRVARR